MSKIKGELKNNFGLFLLLDLNGTYLDMKLQVFIHGINMVKDVVRDPRDNPHELRVMQLPLVGEKHNTGANECWET